MQTLQNLTLLSCRKFPKAIKGQEKSMDLKHWKTNMKGRGKRNSDAPSQKIWCERTYNYTKPTPRKEKIAYLERRKLNEPRRLSGRKTLTKGERME